MTWSSAIQGVLAAVECIFSLYWVCIRKFISHFFLKKKTYTRAELRICGRLEQQTARKVYKSPHEPIPVQRFSWLFQFGKEENEKQTEEDEKRSHTEEKLTSLKDLERKNNFVGNNLQTNTKRWWRWGFLLLPHRMNVSIVTEEDLF